MDIELNKEAEVALKIVDWLESQGWTCYKEVVGWRGRCDIYAVQGILTWAIEVKMNFTLKLLEQSLNWRYGAHYASLAIPVADTRRGEDARHFAEVLCHNFGMGLLYVSDDRIADPVRPVFRRKIRKPVLYEKSKYQIAGNNRSKFWSPFKETTDSILKVVPKDGIMLKELVMRIDHHYHSGNVARACISQWIRCGVIKELQLINGLVTWKEGYVPPIAPHWRDNRVGHVPYSLGAPVQISQELTEQSPPDNPVQPDGVPEKET
jgi:hypothetical protein